MRNHVNRLHKDFRRMDQQADAARIHAENARGEANGLRREAIEARRIAEEKRPGMENSETRYRLEMERRDRLLRTIVNSIDGASIDPVQGWNEYIGDRTERSGLYPGRVWFAPGNEAKENFNQTIRNWKEQLLAAKAAEEKAQEEYDNARRIFDKADGIATQKDREASGKEALADNAEREQQEMVERANDIRRRINDRIDEANEFARKWRQCKLGVLNKLVNEVERAAQEAEQAERDATEGDDPQDREEADERAQQARDRARQAHDELESEAAEVEDDPEIGNSARNSRNRSESARDRANRAASGTRNARNSMPRQCRNGDKKNVKCSMREKYLLDDSRDVLVIYTPQVAVNESAEEAALGLANYFNSLGKIFRIGSQVAKGIPGAKIVSFPLKYCHYNMEAGSEILNRLPDLVRRHFGKIGSLEVRVPVVIISQERELRCLCTRGRWISQGLFTVPGSERQRVDWKTGYHDTVYFENVPSMMSEVVNNIEGGAGQWFEGDPPGCN